MLPFVQKVETEKETTFIVEGPPKPGLYKLQIFARKKPKKRGLLKIPLVATVLLNYKLGGQLLSEHEFRGTSAAAVKRRQKQLRSLATPTSSMSGASSLASIPGSAKSHASQRSAATVTSKKLTEGEERQLKNVEKSDSVSSLSRKQSASSKQGEDTVQQTVTGADTVQSSSSRKSSSCASVMREAKEGKDSFVGNVVGKRQVVSFSGNNRVSPGGSPYSMNMNHIRALGSLQSLTQIKSSIVSSVLTVKSAKSAENEEKKKNQAAS